MVGLVVHKITHTKNTKKQPRHLTQQRAPPSGQTFLKCCFKWYFNKKVFQVLILRLPCLDKLIKVSILFLDGDFCPILLKIFIKIKYQNEKG